MAEFGVFLSLSDLLSVDLGCELGEAYRTSSYFIFWIAWLFYFFT